MTTVLGKTFSTDDERREYFRNELRKLLPELKKIEGFPLGEDEDIIALSDPPYYTACPNPWLNDFIAEWEVEKATLEQAGQREASLEVHAPYASDVSEGKSNPIYNAHTYHTKVPHPAVMRFLLHYTQPGDIILDAFAGTGMTGVAAQVCKNPDPKTKFKIETEWNKIFQTKPVWGERKCICGDLSPYASTISYNYNTPVDIYAFEKEARGIIKEVAQECGWIYETTHDENKKGHINYTLWSEVMTCNQCNNEIVFWDTVINKEKGAVHDNFDCPSCEKKLTSENLNRIWETKFDQATNQIVKHSKAIPVLIIYTFDGKRFKKRPDDLDMRTIDQINETPIKYWFPTDKLPPGDKMSDPFSKGIMYIHHFFTKRNILALSILNKRIAQSNMSGKLRFILTGILNRATVMNRIHLKNFVFGGGGWNVGHLKGTLYIPSLPIETSIIELANDKVSSFIRASKYISSDHASALFTSSANEISIKSDSIDYIFTDPPFGSNIMYSELNLLTEAWLRVFTNNHMEAIENRNQGKNLVAYQGIMTECFREYFRVLKSGKWMTVEFSNTKAAVWNGIQTAIQRAGFIIANVAALDKKQGGMQGIVTPTAVKQDLVISCYKPSSEFDQKFQRHQHEDVGVWDFVEEHLKHLPIHLAKGGSTTAIIERSPKILFDRLVAFYVQRSLPVPIDAGKFQLGLKERFVERDGMYFTPEQAAEYDHKKAAAPNFIQASLFVASEQDGVLFLKNLLERQPAAYQDIHPNWMQALAGQRKGDVIPELMDILQENFLKDTLGRWYVPDPENEVDLEALRSKRLLKQFNQYLETARQPKGKLKEARVEALRAGFRQCYQDKDFKTIVELADFLTRSRLSNLLLEDEVLLQFYDIASARV